MIYQIEKISKNQVQITFVKQNLSFFTSPFSLDNFLKFDFKTQGDKHAAVIASVLEVEKMVDPNIIEQISLVEQRCIKEGCVVLFTSGIFNPLEGLELQIKQKSNAFGALLDYKHVLSLIWWGEFNKELALELGEVEVLIGAGKPLAQLIEIVNPMQVVVLDNLDEFTAALGATDVEQVKKLKLNIKPEQKDTAGLKITALV